MQSSAFRWGAGYSTAVYCWGVVARQLFDVETIRP
jgi:hypothetical protein